MESKGRGRGGVPLLPEGVWDALNRGDKIQENDLINETFEDEGKTSRGTGRGKGPQKDLKGPDWNCLSCGNVNWSWRASCNMCNSARPASALVNENEVRDGVGGGFNERQIRASAASVEVGEDGFDDFGRRVKKGKRDPSDKEKAALARLQQNYGFLLGNIPSGDASDSMMLSTKSKEAVPGQFDDASGANDSSSRFDGGNKYSVENEARSGPNRGDGRDGMPRNGDRDDRNQDRGRDRGGDRDRDRDRDRERNKREEDNRRRERSRERDRNENRSRRDDRDRSRDRQRESDRRGKERRRSPSREGEERRRQKEQRRGRDYNDGDRHRR